jgi:thioredoxin-related protein
LGNIPNDTLILKVDYDSNPDLKSKYKVTSQHTLVQVNQNGDLIKSSPGLYQLNTLDSVLKTF